MNPFEALKQAAEKHLLYQNILKTKGKIVLGKGSKTPEWLFFGEAPGFTENQEGKPFCGKSGKLLDGWIKENNIANYAVINAVPIIPLNEEGGIRAPTDAEIEYFRPYVTEIIKFLSPKFIICLGKSAAKSLQKSFKLCEWQENYGFIYHPSYFLRNGKNGNDEFKKLISTKPSASPNNSSDKQLISLGKVTPTLSEDYISEISIAGKKNEEVVDDFLKKISAKKISPTEFIYENEKWWIDFHNFDHSDDLIIEKEKASLYDKFLLVKVGSDRCRIVGWADKKLLMSTPARDIYRNGKMFYIVFEDNVQRLQAFRLQKEKRLVTEFIINQQQADNLGKGEMISGTLAGLHFFIKKAKLYFTDMNQRDEFVIGEKKGKIFVREAQMDEDMLIHDNYFKAHPEIDYYICCKVKGGQYNYVGYVDKELVEKTRVIQMIGTDSDKASENIRRIFFEQYKNLSAIIPIMESVDTEKEEFIEPQKYFPLHVHSCYSIGDGFGTINYIAEMLKKKGFAGAALTDHSTMGGVFDWQKALLAKGLKPIIGCELTVKEEGDDEHHYHNTIFVKDKTGWKNLLKLHSIGAREHFHYRPIVPITEIFKHHEGLIITSGCSSGLVWKLVEKEDYARAEKVMADFKQTFGDDYYAEFMVHKAINNPKVLEKVFSIAEKLGIKCIFTTDSHYPLKEDKKYHDAVKAINMGRKYGEAGFDDDCFFLMQEADIKEKTEKDSPWILPYIEEMKKNTFEIAAKCDFKIEPPTENDTLPKLMFEKPRKEKMKEMVLAGLGKYTPYKYEGAIKDRIDMELDRIFKKEYDNYFLMVADMVQWAKREGIRCGAGRGSASSSIIALALNITECDPIKFDLLFDRFLSEIRRDLPDIDSDFMDERRDEVFEYLKKTYGETHCAKVATYACFHPKGILRDVGRIFEIPHNEISKMCNLVIERSFGDARSSFSLLDTFAEFKEAKEFQERFPLAADIAIKLEGHIKFKGQHAAGMVVTEHEINEYLPITKIKGDIATEWNKDLVEEMKLTKFDILGLKILSVIDSCVKSSGAVLPTDFEDQKVYDNIFNNGNSLGVSQFESPGMRAFAKDLKIDSFQVLCDANSLYRPSTLHSGQTLSYQKRKNGGEENKPYHPLLEPITKQTQNIILYQEQVMQVMHKIGCMSWANAEAVRKLITKSKGKDAFQKMREEFVRNANKINGIPIEEAENIFDVVSTAGSYGFNKSHSAAYSINSYLCAWLKYYYPKHFFAAILKHEKDNNALNEYFIDAEKNNVKINFPDINKSEIEFELIDDEIFAGLSTINGIGTMMAKKILKNRPYTSLADFRQRTKISDKLLKGLIVADAFREFGINKKKEFTGTDCADFNDLELAQLIYQHTTLKPKLKVLESFDFGKYEFIDLKDLNDEEKQKEFLNRQILIRGIVTQLINKDRLLLRQKHVHLYEPHLFYANIDDGTGNKALIFNPHTYEKYKKIVADLERKAVIAIATVSSSGKKLFCDMLEIVNGSDKELTAMLDAQKAKTKDIYITSAIPAVSKKGKSYYRVKLSDGADGLCFRFGEKLFPGQKIKYKITEKPFINIERAGG